MKGILFKPDMIKAILEVGRKTQTRRLHNLKEINKEPDKWSCVNFPNVAHFWGMIPEDFTVLKPRYRVGETVYIKEAYQYVTLAEKDPWKDRAIKDGTFRRRPDGSPVKMCYKLDGYEIGADWLTPFFMPQWAARYFIQITDVRVERLRDITEEDAIAEGCAMMVGITAGGSMGLASARYAYMKLWDTINKKPYDWNSNPWAWVYGFRLK